MRIGKIFASLAAVSAFATFAARAEAVSINFDGPVDTNITSDFPGVTFVAPGIGTPVRTLAGFPADTSPNVLALSSPGSQLFNQFESTAVDIVFDTPVTYVSIRAAFITSTELYIPFTGSLPFMAVYNSSTIIAANRIGLVSWNNPSDSCFNSDTLCVSAFSTLEFSSAAGNIKAIRVTGATPPSGSPTRRATFDSLVYGIQAAQSITFPQPGNVPTDWSFFHFTSASSGLPVTVTSNSPTICTVSGDTIQLTATAGTCSLTANQAGNPSFLPAAPVTVTFTVFPKNDIAAAQFALLATNTSWRVTPTDPGASAWNTSATFNDSAWQLATQTHDLAVILGRPFFAKAIWTSGGPTSTTETTIWGRKVLTLTQVPTQAWLELGVDDDADLYINGVKVIADTNGVANNASRNIAPYLTVGSNLFAFTARDNFTVFGYQHSFWLQARSNLALAPSVPVPAWVAVVLGAGLLGQGVRTVRKRRAKRGAA